MADTPIAPIISADPLTPEIGLDATKIVYYRAELATDLRPNPHVSIVLIGGNEIRLDGDAAVAFRALIAPAPVVAPIDPTAVTDPAAAASPAAASPAAVTPSPASPTPSPAPAAVASPSPSPSPMPIPSK